MCIVYTNNIDNPREYISQRVKIIEIKDGKERHYAAKSH